MVSETKQSKRKLEHWMGVSVLLAVYDVVAANISYLFALLLRFDFVYSNIPQRYIEAYLHFAPIYSVLVVGVFIACRLYNSIWRFAGVRELTKTFIANVIVVFFHVIVITLFYTRMPISYYIVGSGVQLILTLAIRFAYRYLLQLIAQNNREKAKHNVMIIGAGAAGQMVTKELLLSNRINAKPVCIIDDNSNKWNRYIDGVPVVGGREYILTAIQEYDVDQIFFAIPTAKPEEKRDILNICQESKCEIKSLPGVYQLANGEVLMSKMHPVELEDLLGREPIKVDMEDVFQQIRGRRILVTGGGGSIGSELCRQIAAHKPEMLIIFDVYENNAYSIEQELKRKYGDRLNLHTLIGSVRDTRRIEQVFETYRPDIVYHAAAHKHVPLMETSPNEAIKNNVIGTYKTACAALKYGAKKFVLISTDKAVNPTNIMGASKRLCEMVIQSMDVISRCGRQDLLPVLFAHGEDGIEQQLEHLRRSAEKADREQLKVESVKSKNRTDTQFVAVRFGNVLGSNGSVIPLFKKQIEAGGPVTVTHPDIIRYFMTIPEAVSLVLLAGTYAWGGEIFVLDMGDPVKIDTLARNLIRLSGYKPDVDIKIEYTGLRPGEKLFEEKLMAEEGLLKTDNKMIHIGKPIPFDLLTFLDQLAELAQASYHNDPHIVEMVEQMVPTFHPVGDKTQGNTEQK